ncbi:hypothetical protein L9F63_011294, partial [Diploptera punctata]
MEKLQRVSVLSGILLACLIVSANCAAVRSGRAVAESSPSVNLSEVKICHNSIPCGWAVYIPFTRRVDYFMKNTCECPQGKVCLRSDDDLSFKNLVSNRNDKRDIL